MAEIYKWYLPEKEHQDAIKELIKEVLSNFDEEEKEQLYSRFDFDSLDKFIERLSFDKTLKDNDGMNKYIHMSNHRIEGNFGNLHDDFLYELTQVQNPDDTRLRMDFTSKDTYDAFERMKSELDAGSTSEWAAQARQAIENWYWWAFGTYNYKYNMSNDFQELLVEE